MHFQGDILLQMLQNINWAKVTHITSAFAAIWALLRFKCRYLKRRLDKERDGQNWIQNVEVTQKWRGR